jgi:hypothetical protein
MDRLVETFPAEQLNDHIMICPNHGVAYQKDMTQSVSYDVNYFNKYVGYEGKEIARKINHFRTSLTEAYVASILDMGIGSGEFIKSSHIKTYGFDINPVGVSWLKERGIYHDPYSEFLKAEGVSLWDTLEHIPNPGQLLDILPVNTYLFVSLPIFDDLWKLTESKHYKPNEHYWYWTTPGLVGYMSLKGFNNLECRDDEVAAGRENIGAFVFQKVV